MRKLTWFVTGFCLASLAACYMLHPDALPQASVACGILFCIAWLFALRFRKCYIPMAVLLGAMAAFTWIFCWNNLYLTAPKSMDTQSKTLTLHALENASETEYGISVKSAVRLNGKCYITIANLPKDTKVSMGDTIEGHFTLRSTLPGCSRDSSYHRANGKYILVYTRDKVNVTACGKLPWYCYPAYIHTQLTNRMKRIFPEDTIGFAQALLLGDTEEIDYATDTDLKISGIRHVIAVSGLHVSILFSMVCLVIGRRRWPVALAGLPLLFLFAAVVGFSPSITRACLMHSLMVLALLLNREYDSPTALAFAVLVMLIVNPYVAANVGFQMSVSCVAGILTFTPGIQKWLLDKKRLGKMKGMTGKLLRGVSTCAAVSVSATIFTMPICAIYFGVVSLIGVLTNVLTLWCITYIFCGIIAAVLASVIWIPLGGGIALLVSWGIRYVLFVAKVLADFPLAAVYTESVYIVAWLVFFYVLLALFLCMKRKKPLIFGGCAVLGLCAAVALSWIEPMTDECRVTAVDVGQGQCILLQSAGRNYLVDCGGDSDRKAADKAAHILLSQGISRLDGVILTHYDRDHAGGIEYLLTTVPADCLYLPVSLDEENISQSLMHIENTEVAVAEETMQITFGDVRLTLLPSEIGMTDNESSLCVLFQTKNCDILITGDRSAFGERELLRQIELPDLEVLIVGHHGSKYSTCEELLEATTPEIAIISAGRDNTYGHPADVVLQRLQKYGCLIYRTDYNGTVVYRG